MSELIHTLLLLALPAAGKSEICRYLRSVAPEVAAADFRLARTVELDDYPYVHFMRRVSQELRAQGQAPVFFEGDEHPMLEPRDWRTLIHLLNEDYANRGREDLRPGPTPAAWLLDRLERARIAAGVPAALGALRPEMRAALIGALEDDALQILADRNRTAGPATTVIEFARGGPQGAELPLPEPYGYRYSLAQLSEDILERACILYLRVTPEESRRRNLERAETAAELSTLHHRVPEAVMSGEYGMDDMAWLIDTSPRPGTIEVRAHDRIHYVPVAVFDNRHDKTSFLRADPSTWPRDAVAEIHAELKMLLGGLVRRHPRPSRQG